MYTILLTACINPDGMSFTKISDKNIRMDQYRKALDFYLANTSFPIIFAENSNIDISQYYTKHINNDRLEILTFSGNDNKERGKGYGEANIIEYAINNSKILDKETMIVKITGRLIVENINEVITKKFPLQDKECVICSFNSDFTFPDSRIIISPISFLRHLIEDKEEINDSNGVFFEHILARHIIHDHTHYTPFWIEPNIKGISGTTGLPFESPSKNEKHTISYKIMALQRYSQFCKKTDQHNLIKDSLYFLIHFKYWFLQKNG